MNLGQINYSSMYYYKEQILAFKKFNYMHYFISLIFLVIIKHKMNAFVF